MFNYTFPDINFSKDLTIENIVKPLLENGNIIYYSFNIMNKKGEIESYSFGYGTDINTINDILSSAEYILINYKNYPKRIFLFEKELRGIILRNEGDGRLSIFSRPLHKFYNLNENIDIIYNDILGTDSHNFPDRYFQYLNTPGNEMVAEYKEDGTMIQVVVNYKNELRETLPNTFFIDIPDSGEYKILFNTKNTLRENIYLKDFLEKSEDIVMGISKYLVEISYYIEELYGEKPTINLEYINPELEQHVVIYNGMKIYITDIRLNNSGRYLTPFEKKEVRDFVEKHYDFPDIIFDILDFPNIEILEQIQDIEAKKQEEFIEGYVLKKYEDEGHNILYGKLKTDWYLGRAIPSEIRISRLGGKEIFYLFMLEEIDTLFQKFNSIEMNNLLKSQNIDIDNFKNFINEYYYKLEKSFNYLASDIIENIDYSTEGKLYNYYLEYGTNIRYLNIILERINQEEDAYLYILVRSLIDVVPNLSREEIFEKIGDITFIQDILKKRLEKLMYNSTRVSIIKSIEKIMYMAHNLSLEEFIDAIILKGRNGEYYFTTKTDEGKIVVISYFTTLYNILRKINPSLLTKPNGIFVIGEILRQDLFNSIKEVVKKNYGIDISKDSFFNIVSNIGILVNISKDFSNGEIEVDSIKSSILNISSFIINLGKKGTELIIEKDFSKKLDDYIKDIHIEKLGVHSDLLTKIFKNNPYIIGSVEENVFEELFIRLLIS